MNSPVRFIICAAGQQVRWANHTGRPKHMALIRGEPIIHRTIRLLKQAGYNDIILLAHHPEYGAHGVKAIKPTWNSIMPDTGIGISAKQWAPKKRNTILFGDVWFSDAGMASVLSERPAGITWFGRSGPGREKFRWGELFGVTFLPEDQRRFKTAIYVVRRDHERYGKLMRGWEVMRKLNRRHSPWVEIDDETTDFDYPEDYDRWIERYEHAT